MKKVTCICRAIELKIDSGLLRAAADLVAVVVDVVVAVVVAGVAAATAAGRLLDTTAFGCRAERAVLIEDLCEATDCPECAAPDDGADDPVELSADATPHPAVIAAPNPSAISAP